jgi:thiosulfate/3-mercaptopyruvate sulfurtransferase
VKNLVSYVSFILVVGLSAVILVSAGHAEGTGLPGGNVIAASETDEDVANLAPGSAPLINPEDLVKILQSPKGEKPLILNIGPRALFLQAHIPGSEYIGLSADSQRMEALLARVKPLPHNKFIVLYCGCCPWSHCPNVRPAYYQLHKAGFTRVKVLYIPDNSGTDWVYKGYPTVKGQ